MDNTSWVQQEKKRLREQMLHVRKVMTHETYEVSSQRVCQMMIKTVIEPLISNGKPGVVFTYIPFRKEPDVMSVIEQCWSMKITVLVPRVDIKHREMALYQVTSAMDLEVGYQGIYEPKVTCEKWLKAYWQAIDIVFVPGVVFDRQGQRIGYGGGYYDRFLAFLEQTSNDQKDRPKIIAIAFDNQIVDQLPTEVHDCQVNMIITEKHCYKVYE